MAVFIDIDTVLIDNRRPFLKNMESIMARFFSMLFMIVLLINITNCIASAEENPFETKMPSKIGLVEYDVKGSSAGEGFGKLYWRKTGAEIVKITKTSGKVMGMYPVSSNTRVITTPEWIITITRKEVKKMSYKLCNEYLNCGMNDCPSCNDRDNDTGPG